MSKKTHSKRKGGKGKAAAPTALEVKRAYEIMEGWRAGKPDYRPVNFENNVLEGYRRNELIYACLALKGDSAAQATLRVHRKSDGLELPDHPLQAVLDNPSRRLQLTGFDFHAANFAYLDLAGMATWEIVRGRDGKPAELLPLRPDWMHPVPSPDNFLASWEYKVPGVEKPAELAPEDVLALRIYDPLNWYGGQAPVNVLARSGDVDNEATDHIKNVLERGAVPIGMLSTKLKLTDEEVVDVRRRWRERYAGYTNWTEPAVLDSDATFQKLGFSFQELGFDVLDARNEARICMVLCVPPILVGAKMGLDRSTYSNYAEARKAFWQDTLIPQYKRVRDAMQMALADAWGDIELRWDFSQVVALQEDAVALRAFALQAPQAGGITVHEFRKVLGGMLDEPELDPRVGNVLYVPTGVTVTPIDPKALDEQEAEAEAMQEAMAAQGQPNNEEQPGEEPPPQKGIMPPGAEKPLPALPTYVDVTEADTIRALELWDEAMPEYAGLLGAREQ